MSSALTFIVLGYTNLIGSQLVLNNSAVAPGSIINLVRGPDQPRPNDYTYTPGIGAHKVHTRSASWNRARVYCEEEGAHLAIINSLAEAEAIVKLLQESKVTGGWIGAHDLYQEESFVTIHGETLAQAGFDLWRAGEPNNTGNDEDCAILAADTKLNDFSCATLYSFICELHSARLYAMQDPTHSAGMTTTEFANIESA